MTHKLMLPTSVEPPHQRCASARPTTVVLADDEWATWLDPQSADAGELLAMLEPRDDMELAVRPVSRLVNDVRNDGPELVVPLGA